MPKIKKCNSSAYQKRRSKEKENGLLRESRRRELESKLFKESRERIELERRSALLRKHQSQLLVNTLATRLCKLDPTFATKFRIRQLGQLYGCIDSYQLINLDLLEDIFSA